jgi:hypothetical protein
MPPPRTSTVQVRYCGMRARRWRRPWSVVPTHGGVLDDLLAAHGGWDRTVTS